MKKKLVGGQQKYFPETWRLVYLPVYKAVQVSRGFRTTGPIGVFYRKPKHRGVEATSRSGNGCSKSSDFGQQVGVGLGWLVL